MTQPGPDPSSCEAHGRTTRLACATCDEPICVDCSVHTDVGLKCLVHGGNRGAGSSSARAHRRGWVVGLLTLVVLVAGGAWYLDSRPSQPAAPPVGVSSMPSSGVLTISPAGEGIQQLAGIGGRARWPVWAPDAQSIAIARTVGGPPDLFAVEVADGSLLQLTEHPAPELYSSWSPDGDRLVFDTARDGNPELYLMEVASGGLTRLTRSGGLDVAPHWGPDGRRIVFVSSRDGMRDLYTIDADTGERIQLTDSAASDEWPAWSPDGSRIVFAASTGGPGNQLDLYTIRPDGTGRRRLTDAPTDDVHPTWSPDGSRIAFARRPHDSSNSELAVLELSSGEVTQLTDHPGADEMPAWSPTGDRIAFVRGG